MDSGTDKDENQKYEKDNRTPCKYGARCYQKNPGHHKKFKHPPKKGNENKEVISKKRKSPEDSESSSSNTSKVKKLEPSNEQDSSNKTDDSKINKKATSEETNSTAVTKRDSDVIKNQDDIKNDSIAEKVTSDGTGTNADEKDGNTGTETPSEQEKTNEINDVNSFSNTKENEKMNIEEKSTEEKDAEEKVAEEKAAEEKVAEEKAAEEKATEEKATEVKASEEKVIENKHGEEKDTKAEVKSTDDAADMKTETELDKVEKIADDKSEICDAKNKDSKRPNNEGKISAGPKQNIEEKKTSVKTEISKNDNYNEAKKLIEKAFLVSMPNDFYKFYDFCRDLKPTDPSTALKIAELKLVGPYDILNGLITKEVAEKTNLLTHWRYYYDPPEFQTVIKGNDREGLHFGYWRDRPSSDPVFVATNCSNVSHKIKPVAENIFGAIAYYVEERSKKANPFEKSGYSSILGKLKNFAKKHNISLETQSAKMKSREKNVVARTIHGAGIVCPYNKKSQLGYRELSVTDNQLLKIVKKLDDAQSEEERIAARSELGEVVRLATIAGDECDFGTCLELGHDLLSTGCFHVQNAALSVLSIAYNQLDRQAFLQIVEAHMKNRKKSSNPSALENISKE